VDPRVDRFIEVIRKTVLRLFPELAGRYHLGARARVQQLAEGGWTVQPLTRERADDDTVTAVKVPPLPYTLKPGNVVRLVYLYGDPSEPEVAPVSTAALGTWLGGWVEVPGFGIRNAVVAEHLVEHSRVATLTAPVDAEGNPLPRAVTSAPTRIDFAAALKYGDRVVALPIDEGERFLVVAKL
jgi:hypothetical protein